MGMFIQYISFVERSGTKVSGTIVGDYGHALLVHVAETNRKNIRGKTLLFPKHDMGNLVIRSNG